MFPLLLSICAEGIQLPKSLAAKYLENPNQNRQKVEHLQLFTTISPSFWISIDHFYHQSFIFEKHPELHPTRWAPDPVINGAITPRVITPVTYLPGQLIPNPQPELFGHFGWESVTFHYLLGWTRINCPEFIFGHLEELFHPNLSLDPGPSL